MEGRNESVERRRERAERRREKAEGRMVAVEEMREGEDDGMEVTERRLEGNEARARREKRGVDEELMEGVNARTAEADGNKEGVEERKKRMARDRAKVYRAKKKENITEEIRQQQLEERRIRDAGRIANQTEEEQQQRLEEKRIHKAARIANQTEEQRQQMLEEKRIQEVARIANQTEEQRQERTQAHRELMAEIRINQTQQQRSEINEARRDDALRRRECARNPYLGRNNATDIVEFKLGPMTMVCKHCGAIHFKEELTTRKTFSSCCMGGKIKVPERPLYPDLLQSLLSNSDPTSMNFKTNIRKFNSMFAFASFSFKSVEFNSGGPPTFVIHGQVYHHAARDFVDESEKPAYSQLYFLDPEFAVQSRKNNPINKDCNEETIHKLSEILQQINHYAKAYRMMKEVIAKNGTTEIAMYLVKDHQYDQRRYNLPLDKNEVAAVFSSDMGGDDLKRELCVHPIGTQALQFIPVHNENCDPMTYPLLFPYGEPGWSNSKYNYNSSENHEDDVMGDEEEGSRQGKRIGPTMQEFYSFLIQMRDGEFNQILRAKKLTLQYIIDAFLKIEEYRLQWVRFHQKDLRVETYLGLNDFLTTKANQANLLPGKLLVLPSSFTGGKRYMQQSYQDAMTMVSVLGKPDFFITVTCNPNWTEIKEHLLPGETTVDRPDIVATVFNLKLKEILKDIVEKQVLGKVKGFQYVIEFQKRGLPHAHMLFFLENESKIRDTDDVDSVVSAEIPDETEDPLLYKIISASMIHGPCGDLNMESPCMEDVGGTKGKECTKHYPKDFCEATNITRDGYPQYRRRNDNRTVKKGDNYLDNRWVVPYNRYLSKRFNAHINVEVCSTIKCVKYLFKYVYKGFDQAVVQIKDGVMDFDEIKAYMDARYISSPEAIWRIRQFPMQKRSHTIIRLAVHLPSMQNVVFAVGDSESDRDAITRALQKAEEKGTTLTSWFKLNQKDPNAHQYLYREIPYHYVYDETKRTWNIRKRGGSSILPRMYAVNMKNFELFSMRLMLLHVRGAKSYEELRTVNGVVYPTFREAAKAMNLLDDDSNWYSTMEEAVAYQMPSQLRYLFATILEFGKLTDPRHFYDTFKEYLIEDYLTTFTYDIAVDKCLQDLEDYLSQFGKSCLHHCIPAPKYLTVEIVENSSEIIELQAKASRQVGMLNKEQLEAFNKIMEAVDGESRRRCFFLSGAGGCGKTLVFDTLISTINGRNQKVKVVAPTGLAATLLRNGQTVHTGFGLGLDIDERTISSFRQGTKEWENLKSTKLIIWDEISMCTSNMLDAVDRSLRDLLQLDKPFGGICIVVGGDFRQQAPVLKRSSRLQIMKACVKSSKLWPGFQELALVQNMRVCQNEIEFSKSLLQIGSGLDSSNQRTDIVEIPKQLISEDIIKSVFGEHLEDLSNEELASRAILCPLNEDTLNINEKMLKQLPGEVRSYNSTDTVANCETEEERQLYPMEFLNSLTPSGMPPHILNLKVGCCVMLLRNINPQHGLCNGTRLIVEKMDPNLIHCKIFSGDKKGERVFIPRLRMDTNDKDVPFQLERKQFPLRLAYSMTITKSQGQTFEKIGLYLPQPVFTHGQLYTAMSRVKSKEGLSIMIQPGQNQGKIFKNNENTYTYNCVFYEIL